MKHPDNREAKAAVAVVAAEEAEVVIVAVAVVVAASAADPAVPVAKTSGFPKPSSDVSSSTDTLTHSRRSTLTPSPSRRHQLLMHSSRWPTKISVTRS